MANDSDYGLGGAVWTQDINRAFRVAGSIETGRVWVNTYNQIPEGSPFGGYKQSVSDVRRTKSSSSTTRR